MNENDKLRHSEVDTIPKDWQIMQMQSVVSLFQTGTWGDELTPNEVSYPIIRSTEIEHDGKMNLSTAMKRKVASKQAEKYKLENGDILLVASSGSPDLIGRAAFFIQPHDNIDYLFSNFMMRIRPYNVVAKFLFYWLNSLLYYQFLKSHQQTSTGLRNFPKKEFMVIQLLLPPLPEQKKIAEILSTVDETITQVDTAIEKTERLKKGLMQELLSKGIGHKQFKDTEIGSIPKEWEVKHLGDVTEINKDAKDLPMDYPDHKFLYIDIDSVENGTGKINQAREIMGRDAPSRARRVVYLNDVIMSTVRPYLKAFALIPKNYDGQICSTGFAVLTCKAYLIPQYLLCTLFSKVVIDQCNKMMIGGQYPALNSEQVSKITIPMPLLGEQQQISDILANVDEKVEALKTKKQKYEKVKKQLMNDLLTGNKRVATEAEK